MVCAVSDVYEDAYAQLAIRDSQHNQQIHVYPLADTQRVQHKVIGDALQSNHVTCNVIIFALWLCVSYEPYAHLMVSFR